jgi:molecular chaperone GrpE
MSKKQDDKAQDQVKEPKDEKSESSAKVEQLELKVAELDNQLKRAVADYQNLEKRISEGRSELSSFVAGELVQKLLQVLDHLEQATNGASETDKQSGWFKGVEMAVKQFKDVLRLEGLEEIQSVGEFNPTLHEAVDIKEGDDNMIIEVTRRGYSLNGKVLRPAQVVVGRKAN